MAASGEIAEAARRNPMLRDRFTAHTADAISARRLAVLAKGWQPAPSELTRPADSYF
jgi:hypothetical protein